MFYDDLLDLKERLEKMLFLVSSDANKSLKQISHEQEKIRSRIYLIEEKLNDIKKNQYRYPKIYDVYQVRVFKKEIKHEFLTQVKNGYSYFYILNFLTHHFDNPGINVERFIHKLLYNDKNGYGYFKMDAHGKLSLVPKAERYLENVANIHLKR